MRGYRALVTPEPVGKGVAVRPACQHVGLQVSLCEELDHRNRARRGNQARIAIRRLLPTLIDGNVPGRAAAVEIAVIQRFAVGTEFESAEDGGVKPCVSGTL